MTDAYMSGASYVSPDWQCRMDAAAAEFLSLCRQVQEATVPAAELATMNEAERTGAALCAAIESLLQDNRCQLIPSLQAMAYTVGSACACIFERVDAESLTEASTSFVRGVREAAEMYARTPVPPEFRQ